MIHKRKRSSILCLGVIGLLVVLGQEWIQSGKTLVADLSARRFDNQAERSRTFRIETERWTEFDVLPRATGLRIATNAALFSAEEPTPTFDGDPRRGARYCMQYEIVDGKGTVLFSSEYHFRAKLAQFVDEKTGENRTPAFFEDSTHLPATTRTLPLTLDCYDGKADRIRLRLISHDAQVADVVARVFCRVERQDFEDPTVWRRLSEQARRRLTRATVYPADLMTVAERRELLRWLWTPSAPIGMEGDDFEMRRLYVHSGLKGRPDDEFETPDGAVVHAHRKVTVPLPDAPGTATIEFSSLEHAEKFVTGNCRVEWFGHQDQQYKIIEHGIEQLATEVSIDCAGGLLQISGDVPVSATVRWRPGALVASVVSSQSSEEPATLDWGSKTLVADPDGEFDITPSTMPARMFKLFADQPLEFSISHLGEQPTPFQLVLRTFSSEPPKSRWPTDGQVVMEPASAVWQFLDESETVIREGMLDVDSLVSEYDHLKFAALNVSVTDPSKYYFMAPPNVAKIRVLASRGRMVASGFTRPWGAMRSFVVPDDYLPGKRNESTRRSWFVIRPDGYETLINENKSVPCRTQLRPPEEKPHLLSGDYEWEEFAPQERVTSRFLLAERVSSLAIREQALPLSFREMPVAKPFRGRWIHGPNQMQLAPKLIYQVTGKGRPRVSITVDGEQVFEKRLMAQNGELELPRVDWEKPDCEHTFRFDVSAVAGPDAATAVRLFVSYLEDTETKNDAKTYTKRLVHRLQPQMQFVYEKRSSEPELLAMRVFQKASEHAVAIAQTDEPPRLELRLRMEPFDVGAVHAIRSELPTRSFSITQRAFRFRPPRTNGTIALGAPQTYDQGELCFVKLDEDLPAGRYTIHIDGLGDGVSDGYLLMFRSLPGVPADRRIYSEFREVAGRE